MWRKCLIPISPSESLKGEQLRGHSRGPHLRWLSSDWCIKAFFPCPSSNPFKRLHQGAPWYSDLWSDCRNPSFFYSFFLFLNVFRNGNVWIHVLPPEYVWWHPSAAPQKCQGTAFHHTNVLCWLHCVRFHLNVFFYFDSYASTVLMSGFSGYWSRSKWVCVCAANYPQHMWASKTAAQKCLRQRNGLGNVYRTGIWLDTVYSECLYLMAYVMFCHSSQSKRGIMTEFGQRRDR